MIMTGISAKQAGKSMSDFMSLVRLEEHGVEVLISADTYDELVKFSSEVNEPLSLVADKAIKQYINME